MNYKKMINIDINKEGKILKCNLCNKSFIYYYSDKNKPCKNCKKGKLLKQVLEEE